MSSTNSVDFSVRQNKSIEREIVFDGLRQITTTLKLRNLVYVGLGSVWFADFVMAHRWLGIHTMHSIERDEVVYKRAKFNQPYRTVEVHLGESATVIPTLLDDSDLSTRPWIVWLDYDRPIDLERVSELSYLVAFLPLNSVLLTTFNASPGKYGALNERQDVLREIFGDSLAADELHNRELKDESFVMTLLASSVIARMTATALQFARPGGFEPAFSMGYQDSSPMVTVGGFLPAPDNVDVVRELVRAPDWRGRVQRPIVTPPLTSKEIGALQASLPRAEPLTRTDVEAIGFDLLEEQLASFVEHYLHFPRFAQIAQ